MYLTSYSALQLPKMAGDFQLDSLPYYDQVYNDPSAREVVRWTGLKEIVL